MMSRHTATQSQTATKTTFTPATSVMLQRQCVCGQHTSGGSECESCRKKREGTLLRPAISPSSVQEVLRSPGQPLDPATRTFMEPRFGHDFSRVRVHTDARAAESARAVNALAYTVGRDVVFGVGQYAPGTSEGRRMLAHELTHVMQQHSGSFVKRSALTIGPKNNAAEDEATQISQNVGNLKQSSSLNDPSSRPRILNNSEIKMQRQANDREERQYSEDCTQYIRRGGAEACEFYRCREANTGHACGPRGYYLGYGLKYCNRFSQSLHPKLSGAGKDWLDKTRLCLMNHVHQNIPWDAPCADVKRSAFDSHPNCYVRGGICFLPSSDWLKILEVIDPQDNDLKQAIITGVACLFNWLPLAFPATSLGAGGGYRGLMERDRRRVFGF
jgi:hypothetical protein